MNAIVGRRIVSFGTKPAGNYAHVKKITRHGITWDSKKEADRYDALLILLKAERIRNLQRQVLYRLEVNGVLIAKYTADFVYEEDQGSSKWVEITEDVKGWPNERWPMKRKLFRALFGREIRVT
jgi:hypothetical protein